MTTAVKRLRPLRTVPVRAVELVAHRAARLGEEHGWESLIYNPVTMLSYHRLAVRDADGLASAVLGSFPTIHRVVDVGAGSGAFVAALRRRGVDAVGLERSVAGRWIGRAQGAPMKKFDLAGQPLVWLGGDVASCFEVAEHLDVDLGKRLVAYLVASAPVVVFTAAQPGQGGYGHVNEQPRSYWEHAFGEYGYSIWGDGQAAFATRLAENNVEGPWFHQNLLVLRRLRAER